MKSQSPPFNAQERDIDLLLLEEIHCNPAFLAWVTDQLKLSEATLFSAQHSVYRCNGETDVLVLVDTPTGRVALMIEDKIGAGMQPRQAERYRERGQLLCEEGAAARFYTLLCAPQNYLTNIPSDSWHATLSFEQIADWFGTQADARAEWRRAVLMEAVNRQRRSTIDVPDGTLAKFKTDYQRYVSSTCPEFSLTVQPGRDREFYFKQMNFPAYMRLKHSFSTSTMVLVCENHWKEEALKVLSGRIPNDMQIHSFDSTVHLVVGVEPIDLSKPLEGQTDLVDLAMDAARRLLPYATMVQLA